LRLILYLIQQLSLSDKLIRNHLSFFLAFLILYRFQGSAHIARATCLIIISNNALFVNTFFEKNSSFFEFD